VHGNDFIISFKCKRTYNNGYLGKALQQNFILQRGRRFDIRKPIRIILIIKHSVAKNFTKNDVVVLKAVDEFAKLRESLKFVYTNHVNEFDWLLKTNDHSFIVLENLRHLLYQYETDWPLVIGQRFLREVFTDIIIFSLSYFMDIF
jgi:hypothetical protein